MGQDANTPHHRQCRLEDRLIIQNGLDEAHSLNAIAKKIGKHRSAVSLEGVATACRHRKAPSGGRSTTVSIAVPATVVSSEKTTRTA